MTDGDLGELVEALGERTREFVNKRVAESEARMREEMMTTNAMQSLMICDAATSALKKELALTLPC